jgi:squalene-hopene cyclase-like protein
MKTTGLVLVIGLLAMLGAPRPIVAEDPGDQIPLGDWRRAALARNGGEPARKAIAGGLRWLAAHQHENGHWDADGFQDRCTGAKCSGEGYALFDPGITGIALLAFLSAGETPTAGPHRATVKRGLKYLRINQDPEGCIGPRTTSRFTYNHAFATLALIEVAARTGSKLWRSTAQKAVDFAVLCQNPGKGWRYGVRPQDSDTSLTCWMVLVMRTADASGLKVPKSAFTGARAWIDEVTDKATGRACYVPNCEGAARPQDIMDEFPAEKSASMTAAALFTRLLLGEPAKAKVNRLAVKHCLTLPPVWNPSAGSVDMYYWSAGSLAFFQMGGASWKRWNDLLLKAVLPHQEKAGCLAGSWKPAGPWGREGGRVYSTALMTLALQTCFRYPPEFGGIKRGAYARIATEGWLPASRKDDVPLEGTLDRLITVSLDAMPLEDAVKVVAEAAGVKIRIDPTAAAARKKPVSFSLKEKKLRVALGLLAAYTGLKWEAAGDGYILRAR